MKTNNVRFKVNAVLVLFYCSLLVFGQLPTLIGELSGYTLKPADLILLLLLLTNIDKLRVFKPLSPLLFSSLIALLFFPLGSLLTGFAYVIRILGVLVLGRVLYEYPKIVNQKQIIPILLSILGLVALLGWIQYLFIPDLRPLAVLGWDDHYFRLTSTYLDPAFTGILMVFGVLISLIDLKSKNKYFVSLFFFLTMLFTYSRASYLSLAVGLFIYYLHRVSFKKIVFACFSFALILFLLPRPGGEGVKLERLYSILYKAQNASFGMKLIEKSPLFGFGYNNVCVVSTSFSPVINKDSNSCSGLDNSIQTFLLSFGFVGAIVVLQNLIVFYRKYPEIKVGVPVFVAFFVHAQFTNTLFYQYCLGFLTIYTVVALMKKR